MSEYQALYRAWRPERFRDIYGQEPITRTLKRQVQTGRVAHAYLFCGSRGTGKTTTAKVLSRALNCTNSTDGEPCGECAVCKQLKNESSLDVLEIDAASNNGVDEVRALRDRIAYPPTVGKYKVYIIDEVHMLSTSAFNALLKTLEEPPAHAIFILATTEPQRLPATVLSRCQRYDFKRIPVKDIVARLQVVLEGIGRSCSHQALEEIAVSADGGMRDALSLMDMCLSYTDGEVDAELVRQVLGSNGREFMFEFTDALAAGDAAKALTMIDTAMLGGKDPAVFAREVAQHLRTVLIAAETGESVAEIAQLTSEAASRFIRQAESYESVRLMRSMDLFIKAEGDMRYVAMPRSVIEMCAVKAARISNEKTAEGLSERVEALEKRLREGVFVAEKPFGAAANAPKAPQARPAPITSAEHASEAPGADGDRALFEQAVSYLTELGQNKRAFMFIKHLTYLRSDGELIYASLPSSFTREILEPAKDEITEVFSRIFGRPVRFSISIKQDAPNADAGINSATLTNVADNFGRENMELTE